MLEAFSWVLERVSVPEGLLIDDPEWIRVDMGDWSETPKQVSWRIISSCMWCGIV